MTEQEGNKNNFNEATDRGAGITEPDVDLGKKKSTNQDTGKGAGITEPDVGLLEENCTNRDEEDGKGAGITEPDVDLVKKRSTNEETGKGAGMTEPDADLVKKKITNKDAASGAFPALGAAFGAGLRKGNMKRAPPSRENHATQQYSANKKPGLRRQSHHVEPQRQRRASFPIIHHRGLRKSRRETPPNQGLDGEASIVVDGEGSCFVEHGPQVSMEPRRQRRASFPITRHRGLRKSRQEGPQNQGLDGEDSIVVDGDDSSIVVAVDGEDGSFVQEELVPAPQVSSSNLVEASLVRQSSVNLARADPVDPEEILNAEQRKKQRERERRRPIHIIMAVLGFLGLAAGITLAVVLSKSSRDDKDPGDGMPRATPDPQTAAPTPYVIDLPDYTLLALKDPDSPQSKAYAWLLNDPHLLDYKPWRLLQRYALATFFFATDGDNWKRNTDWLSYDVDECQWFWNIHFVGSTPCFLYLTSNSRYVDFHIYDNNLKGTIPLEIGLLTDVQKIDFEGNDLVGTIPTQLFSLPNLWSVVLVNNRLKGTLPKEVGKLWRLLWFEIGHNLLSGQLPSEIGLLTRLTRLNVDHTMIEGPIPTTIGGMVGLQNISLSQNPKLSGRIPSELGEATGLEEVYLADSNLDGQLPSQIGNLQKLEKLALYSNRITGQVPTEVGLLQSMQGMWLSSNLLHGMIPSQVGSMRNLSYLLLDSNEFSGHVPSEIVNLELKKMDISENNLSGTIPASLCMFDPSIFVFDCSASLCGCHCPCLEE